MVIAFSCIVDILKYNMYHVPWFLFPCQFVIYNVLYNCYGQILNFLTCTIVK